MNKLVNLDYGLYKFNNISYEKYICIDNKKKI